MTLKLSTPAISLALLAAVMAFGGCATPLMKAAAAGDNEQVAALVGQADAKQKGRALYSAVFAGKLETVKLLLSRGADANADGVLICPAEKQGAVMSLLAKSQDMPVSAPVLVMAAHNGAVKIMQALLDAGADVNGAVKKVMQWPCNNYTSLIFGVRDNNIEVVSLLLDRGANREARGGRLGGRTALEWAERWSSSPEIIAMLRSAGTEGAGERRARAEAAKKKAEAETAAAIQAVGGAAEPAKTEEAGPAATPAPKPKPKPATASKDLDSQL